MSDEGEILREIAEDLHDLRRDPYDGDRVMEAADEIEQLRAALTALVDEIGTDMLYHSQDVTEMVEAALAGGGDDA